MHDSSEKGNLFTSNIIIIEEKKNIMMWDFQNFRLFEAFSIEILDWRLDDILDNFLDDF